MDKDPEKHSFELGPVTDQHLMREGGHVLEITNPTHGSPHSSSALFRLDVSELRDLHETIGFYLEEIGG